MSSQKHFCPKKTFDSPKIPLKIRIKQFHFYLAIFIIQPNTFNTFSLLTILQKKANKNIFQNSSLQNISKILKRRNPIKMNTKVLRNYKCITQSTYRRVYQLLTLYYQPVRKYHHIHLIRLTLSLRLCPFHSCHLFSTSVLVV